jgi:hypothetical protein
MRQVSFVGLILLDLMLLRSRAIFGDFFREKFYLQVNSIGTKFKITEGSD